MYAESFNDLREQHPEMDDEFEKVGRVVIHAQASPCEDSYLDALIAIRTLENKFPDNKAAFKKLRKGFKKQLLKTLLDWYEQWANPKRKLAHKYVITEVGKARQFINRKEGYVYQIYVEPGDTEEQFKAIEPFIARLVPEPWTRLLNGWEDCTCEHYSELTDEERGSLTEGGNGDD